MELTKEQTEALEVVLQSARNYTNTHAAQTMAEEIKAIPIVEEMLNNEKLRKTAEILNEKYPPEIKRD